MNPKVSACKVKALYDFPFFKKGGEYECRITDRGEGYKVYRVMGVTSDPKYRFQHHYRGFEEMGCEDPEGFEKHFKIVSELTTARKGLLVSVFRTNAFGDCSNHGVTAFHDTCLLLNDEGPFEDNGKWVVLIPIRWKPCGEERIYAQPDILKSEQTMMGGAFIWSCDDRFPHNYPIPVHDRVE